MIHSPDERILISQPTNAYGTHKYISSPTSSSVEKVDEFADPDSNALSILETQFLNYASRTGSILDEATSSACSSSSGVPRLSRVYATGGASANTTILSMAADIFGSNVCKNVEYEPETGWVGANWNACSVGMAYKARWGYERTMKGREMVQFDELIHDCREERRIARKKMEGKDLRVDADVDEGVRIMARPGKGSEAYAKSIDWWANLETRALKEGEADGGKTKVNGVH
jgi:xylulokinase